IVLVMEFVTITLIPPFHIMADTGITDFAVMTYTMALITMVLVSSMVTKAANRMGNLLPMLLFLFSGKSLASNR
ncbi:MAG: hypothetical protein MUP16_02965, partial [Sedimentisphaerales bacterium]|nr:hypothetical protein [Sedimentisphaerales bacterium]